MRRLDEEKNKTCTSTKFMLLVFEKQIATSLFACVCSL